MAKERTSFELFRLAASVFALEFGYACETAYVTPLLFALGLPPQVVSIVWALGPLCGVVLQPLLGALSDRCTSRYGRRRPFIVGLSVFLCLGFCIIPNAQLLANFLSWSSSAESPVVQQEQTSNPSSSSSSSSLVIALTIFGVFLVDVCSDTLQSPVRVYMIDVTPLSQQDRANSLFGLLVGLGGGIGYLCAATDWLSLSIFFTVFGTQLRAVCVFASLTFALFMAWTVTSVPEQPYSPDDDSANSASSGSKKSWSALVRTLFETSYLRPLCVMHFTGFLGYMCCLLYYTDFVATLLYQGRADALLGSEARTQYDTGVRMGSLGLAIYAFSACLYSLCVPSLLNLLGARLIYFLSYSLFAVAFLAVSWAQPFFFTIFLVPCAAGVFFGTIYTVPYIVLAGFEKTAAQEPLLASGDTTEQGNTNNYGSTAIAPSNGHDHHEQDSSKHEQEQTGENAGLNLAVLNVMQMFAQLFLSACAGWLISSFGSVSSVMVLGAVSAGIGALCAFSVILPPSMK